MLTGEESICLRYYISCLPLNPEHFLECSRKHWEVENSLHWTLDVVFKENERRARTKNTAKKLGILRLITLNIVRNFPVNKSLKRKRRDVALSPDYLLSLLAGIVN